MNRTRSCCERGQLRAIVHVSVAMQVVYFEDAGAKTLARRLFHQPVQYFLWCNRRHGITHVGAISSFTKSGEKRIYKTSCKVDKCGCITMPWALASRIPGENASAKSTSNWAQHRTSCVTWLRHLKGIDTGDSTDGRHEFISRQMLLLFLPSCEGRRSCGTFSRFLFLHSAAVPCVKRLVCA